MPIRIRSKKAGFRRCGIAHPAEWVEYADDAFSDEQLDALYHEPMLHVVCTHEAHGRDQDAPAEIVDPAPEPAIQPDVPEVETAPEPATQPGVPELEPKKAGRPKSAKKDK